MSKKLVAFFSASGTTKKVAQMIAEEVKADLFEIEPKVPYTKPCFLQALFGEKCKIFLENVASPNWRKLQSLDRQLFCQP